MNKNPQNNNLLPYSNPLRKPSVLQNLIMEDIKERVDAEEEDDESEDGSAYEDSQKASKQGHTMNNHMIVEEE